MEVGALLHKKEKVQACAILCSIELGCTRCKRMMRAYHH